MRTRTDDSSPNPGGYARGIRLYRKGKYERAISDLEPLCLQRNLTGRIARFYCGMAHRALGFSALRQGRFELAERELKIAARMVGRRAELSEYLQVVFSSPRRGERRLKDKEKTLSRGSESVESWRSLAQAQWRCGRRSEAQMTLHEGLRQLGDEPELHVQLGLFHAEEEDFVQAREHLEKATEIDGTNPDAHYYLALAMAGAGDVERAARAFQRAFILKPDDLLVAYQLAISARIAQEKGLRVAIRLPSPRVSQIQPRIEGLGERLADEPEIIDAFLSLPESEGDAELFSMLVGVLQLVLRKYSGVADLQLQYSRLLHRLGRIDKAINHARRALRINPEYTDAMLHLGRLYARDDRRTEAIEVVRRAISHGADFPDVHCFAAELMCQSDRREQARDHLHRALQLNPNYTQASEALKALAA